MSAPSTSAPRRGIVALVAGLLALGVIARVLPLVSGTSRMLRQYPSEDGYLMLTIARNLALGHGMATADGAIPTNGTQPLVNFLWAAGLWLFDADRVAGVAWALWWQVAFACASAWALYALGRRLLGEHPWAREIAALGAAGWFAQMLTCMHGMNCLETGGYVLAILAFALALVGRAGDPLVPWSTRRALGLGILLGVCAWVRIDAVFLIGATCLARALLVEEARFGVRLRNLTSAVLCGATAVVVVSPWLLHNKLRFGAFRPISGTAQDFDAVFGGNLTQAVANTAEYALVVLPVPQRLEKLPLVNGALALVLAGALLVTLRAFRAGTPRARTAIVVLGGFCVALFCYYGLSFGAPHFVGRYLQPTAPFLALVWSATVTGAFARSGALRRPALAVPAGLALVALMSYPHVRLWHKEPLHGHFQVVEWVEDNVPDEAWVGAPQTGTLGYFHDRTLNLDGKVNPVALEHVLARTIPEYIVEQDLSYLIDWNGIALWTTEFPRIRDNYELIVDDERANLAVIARKDLARAWTARHAR